MLIQILILAIISAAQATYLHGGKSVSSREDYGHGNYIFSYDIEDPLGATNGRYEIGDAYGNKKGGYKITDIDGRVRWVEYVADEHGFRVVVNTNEPGTAASHPASAVISSPYTENQPVVPVSTVKTVVRPIAVAPIAVESVKKVHPVAVAPVAPVPIGSVKGVSHPVAVAAVAPVPIGSVKGVSHPVAVAPVAPVSIGSVKKVHPIPVDHISQTVHEVPFDSVKGVSHPAGIAPVAPVPIGSVKKGHPIAVDHISQTVHEVPVEHVKGISHPVAVDVSQTVHDVPIGSVHTVVQQPVHADFVPQTVQEIPFDTVQETLHPVKIAQTVDPPKKFFSGGIHQVGPVIRRARTFREAQAAHAASLRPNLYNGEYGVKYQQPYAPVVKRFRPEKKVRKYPLLQYPGVPNIDSLQLIDSVPVAGVSANVVPVTSLHASPVTHVKGTPFHQNGLLRHVYGSSLKNPGYFRSHLL